MNLQSKTIPLFYWSSIKFEGKLKENYGDLLGKYLVEKISGKEVEWVHPKKQSWFKWNKKHYLTVGSILAHATEESVVWGSGIIDRKHHVSKADFRAVRGPRTRGYLVNLGYDCPEVYGDPALLLPNYYEPKIEKEYQIGIAPHYVDYQKAKSWYGRCQGVQVIDLITDEIEKTTNEILKCESIISSSLHGMIIAHAYGIPAVWVKFSDNLFGDDVKFSDYLESAGLGRYLPHKILQTLTIDDLKNHIKRVNNLPNPLHLKKLQQGLIQSCPLI